MEIPTRSYIIGICREQIKSKFNLSNRSLVVEFSKAKETLSFQSFQQLADWIAWMLIWFPSGIEEKDLSIVLAQNSYFWCYRLTGRRLILFEELADTFPLLIESFRSDPIQLFQFLLNDSAVLLR